MKGFGRVGRGIPHLVLTWWMTELVLMPMKKRHTLFQNQLSSNSRLHEPEQNLVHKGGCNQ